MSVIYTVDGVFFFRALNGYSGSVYMRLAGPVTVYT